MTDEVMLTSGDFFMAHKGFATVAYGKTYCTNKAHFCQSNGGADQDHICRLT